MNLLLSYILIILVIGFFLYIKLIPFKDKLDDKHLRIFNIFEKLFQPMLLFFKSNIKPYKVGEGIALDLGQVIVILILLLFINFL